MILETVMINLELIKTICIGPTKTNSPYELGLRLHNNKYIILHYVTTVFQKL